jgi:hypothetical protein
MIVVAVGGLPLARVLPLVDELPVERRGGGVATVAPQPPQ